MSEHTPGPWAAEIEDHKAPSDWYAAAVGVGSPWDGSYRTIARVDGAQPSYDTEAIARAEADARLIAAAPDLLTALEAAIFLMDRVAGWEDDGAPITKFAAKVHGDEFRAAVAKAKGGAS